MPSPLASPRTKPFETKSRNAGEVSRKGLSVHLGVQGIMTRSTPKVAHKVTKSKARILSNHSSQPLGRDCSCGREIRDKASLSETGGWGDSAAGGMILGSALTRSSRETILRPFDSHPSGYFTTGGL